MCDNNKRMTLHRNRHIFQQHEARATTARSTSSRRTASRRLFFSSSPYVVGPFIIILFLVDSITRSRGVISAVAAASSSSSSSSSSEQETSSATSFSSSPFTSPLPALFYATGGTNSNHNLPPPLPTNVLTGLIDDASCHMEDLERANDSQLYTILQELKATAFFRTFVVDLKHKCPLQSWRTTTKKGGDTSSSSSNDSKNHNDGNNNDSDVDDDDEDDDEEDDEFECPGGAGDSISGAEAAFHEPAAEPLCMVKSEEEDASSSSSFLFDSNALFLLSQDGFQSKEQKKAFKWKKETDMVVSSQEDPSCQDDDDEDDTPSTSSRTSSTRKTASTIVVSASQKNIMAASKTASTTTTKTSSSLSDSLSSSITARRSDASSSSSTSTPTLLEGGFPDSFWMDMCSSIRSSGEHATVVNLARNPEHNTGYNGTHIWRAIYEENCLPLGNNGGGGDGDDDDEYNDQCLEERVLYRLLSGLHASTTISIAYHYYPPAPRKNRTSWESNPTYFMQKFAHHEDYIRNLHFSYVVLLRALTKASKFLYRYQIRASGSNHVVDDETATVLLRRLLDSTILQSCASVFSAFDESLMFQQQKEQADLIFTSSEGGRKSKQRLPVRTLQQQFKGVFHNVSSILDCVQCQQCKLHGKMAMLGYGTALRILFMNDDDDSDGTSNNTPMMNRNEMVALINTLAKFSESIRHVRSLTQMYWTQQYQQQENNLLPASGPGLLAAAAPAIPSLSTININIGGTTTTSTTPATSAVPTSAIGSDIAALEHVDIAVGLIASLGKSGKLSNVPNTDAKLEMELVQLALQRQPELLILAKHYAHDVDKFWTLLQQSLNVILSSASSTSTLLSTPPTPDAIIVGTGLAGLAAALTILDRGGRVILLEKEHLLGGNSNKASSGINACCFDDNATTASSMEKKDSLDIFRNDTTRSAGKAARPELIERLVNRSAAAVSWLTTRVAVDLSLKSQLGGHSAKRTHRPSNGMAGAEIIYGMQKAVRAFEKTGHVQILVDTKVTQLLLSEHSNENGTKSVIGVEYHSTLDKDNVNVAATKLYAPNVILATGGFASDRSDGSYLAQNRPELLGFPTTAGAFSTGDGITMAKALGAGMVDMDKVQLHPTGWVDSSDPDNKSKVLAAELMRGVGGILINQDGERFCDELGTRSYVTRKMLSHDKAFVESGGKWDINSPVPRFFLVLSSSAAASGKKHVDLYTHKKLMARVDGVAELAKFMGMTKAKVIATLQKYQKEAGSGKDEFGKTTFSGIPDKNLETEVFYVGIVTPVLHYCMGGITIDRDGSVLDQEGNIIPGLHAAGEVTGGVHGVNRLGGNSLLECTVYGTIVGEKIPIQSSYTPQPTSVASSSTTTTPTPELRRVPRSELQRHNTEGDCWVAIHGTVYDMTLFALEHPAGPESINALAGKDGSEAFDAVHSLQVLDEVKEDRIGRLVD